MDRRTDHHHNHDDWRELWRGARLTAVAVTAAVITCAGVIALGQQALGPFLTQPDTDTDATFVVVSAR